MADAVEISSSWQSSADLADTVSICSSSGEVLQQSPNSNYVILTQPLSSDSSAPLLCWIYINVTRLLKLRGCPLVSVCLISSSRTVEMYTEEEEYISTSRGVLETKENEKRAYRCNFDLTTESSSPVIMMKLLSLHGKKEVSINRICLTLQDPDESSSPDKVPDLTNPHGGPVDFQAMLSSLPTTNAPPLLHSIISSLQHLHVQTSSNASSSVSSAPPPSEIGHIASLLRQMRPQSSENQSCGEEMVNGEVTEGAQEDDCIDPLERRLRTYIDERFDQLMKCVEGKFEELRQQLQTLIEKKN